MKITDVKITDDCISCGMCEEVCPIGAIEVRTDEQGAGYNQYQINKDVCINCGDCLEVDCPAEAIKEG